MTSYGVNMHEAENEDIQSYKSFNDFFTRTLKPGIRPVEDQGPKTLVSPCDGRILCFGEVTFNKKDGYVVDFIKGHSYPIDELLVGIHFPD